VLRLSKNWLVARLMAVYVEGFRNIPLLLWILVIFAVMTESTPQPRDFRGEDASASMILFDSVAVTNRGIFMPGPGLGPEFGDPGRGLPRSRWSRSGPSGATPASGRNRPATSCRSSGSRRPLLRAVDPLLLHPGSTGVAGLPRAWRLQLLRRYPAEELADRACGSRCRSIPAPSSPRSCAPASSPCLKGQTEAAYALGLRPNRTMNLVILPQALRVIIPPLISQYLNLTKNSSLAIAVGYMDVRSTLGGITINQTGRELEGMLLLGLFYLVTSLIISAR
jgi:general L-amino acid transport system permease protein